MGSVLRFLISGWAQRLDPSGTFPAGTLVVNTAGCLAVGLLAGLAEARSGVPMQKPKIPVVSNVDARVHDDPEEIRQFLIHARELGEHWQKEQDMRTALTDSGGRLSRRPGVLRQRPQGRRSCSGVDVTAPPMLNTRH